jgi:DNA repair exonuclease SbcCD ATPase subunit
MTDDRYILQGKSFVDTKTNQCLNFGIKDLSRVLVQLNNMEMWLNQDKETIADLESKLTESEDNYNDIKELNIEQFYSLTEMIKILQDENIDLKQQLAEKDQTIKSLQEINQSLGQTCNNDAKEIDRLNKLLAEEKNRNKKLNHEAQKYYEDAYCNDFQNEKAIAELEKVVEFIKEYPHEPRYWDITSYINQQIKSLKGEK